MRKKNKTIAVQTVSDVIHPGLNAKQQIFADKWLETRHITNSAIAAGYSEKTGYVQGSKLLRNPKISDYLRSRLNDILTKEKTKADAVIRGLLEVAFSDITDYVDKKYELVNLHDLPPHLRRAIKSIKFNQYGIEIQLYDKTQALAELSKIYRLVNETAPPDGEKIRKNVFFIGQFHQNQTVINESKDK